MAVVAIRKCRCSPKSRVRVAVGAQVRGLEPQGTEWLGAKLCGFRHVRDESPAPWAGEDSIYLDAARNRYMGAIAEGNDLVGRNVAALVKPPQGRSRRPSKSFTLDQAKALLAVAENTRLHAYVVLNLLVGIRTQEARALRWDHDCTSMSFAFALWPASGSTSRRSWPGSVRRRITGREGRGVPALD